MIIEGKGEFQKRLDAGICPKCHSQLVQKPDGYDCVICGLEIKDEKKSPNR
jgi:Zn finger protein HypA/HybF involved in hydrogenase expression